MSDSDDRLLADAHALQRLAQHEDWAVLDRLLAEQIARVQTALRARGLGLVETEALRTELDVLEWLRTRPGALAQAVKERDAMLAARAALSASSRPERPELLPR